MANANKNISLQKVLDKISFVDVLFFGLHSQLNSDHFVESFVFEGFRAAESVA